MAEPLSIVASGIAVVQATVGLGTAISKLRNLWDEVREVPETIRLLLEKVEIIECTLSCIETSLKNGRLQRLVEDDVLLQRSVQHCRKANETLSDLIGNLNKDIESSRKLHRTVKKMKVLLKKDTMTLYEERLRDAVQLMSMARQGYMMSLMVVQTELLNNRLPLHTTCTNGNRDAVHQHGSCSRTLRAAPGDEETWITKDTMPSSQQISLLRKDCYSYSSHKRRPTRRVRFHALKWITGHIIEVQTCRAQSGWQFNLRSYTIQSRHSHAFDYICKGRIDEARRLWDEGLASPFDRDDCGWTTMHYAVRNRQPELIRALLDVGVDIQESTGGHYSFPPLLLFDQWWWTHGGKRSHIFQSPNMAHQEYWKPDPGFHSLISKALSIEESMSGILDSLIVAEAFDDVDIRLAFEFISYGAAISGAPMTVRRLMLHLEPHYYSLPVSGRVRLNSTVFGLPSVTPAVLHQIIRDTGLITADDIKQCHKAKLSLLHYVAWRCGFHLEYPSLLQSEESASWYELLLEVLAAAPEDLGSRHYATQHPTCVAEQYDHPMTPLFAFLVGICDTSQATKLRSQFKMMLAVWLRILKDAGINLMSYGRREAALFAKSPEIKGIRWKAMYEDTSEECVRVAPYSSPGPKIRSIRYGPEVSDWSLEWDLDAEEFAGEFWELVENPTLRIPGAWVD